MTHDDVRGGRDSGFKTAGVGLTPMFRCLGCDQARQGLGARGVGLRRRCANCVSAAAAKKGEAQR